MNASKPAVDAQAHWDDVYRTKDDAQLSWHQDEPAISLQLVREHATTDSHILDVGGGCSLLAARLLSLGYRHVAVLDIAPSAIERARTRIGPMRDRIRWIVGDITKAADLGDIDLWHDRAVFHFLTQSMQRENYISVMRASLRPGGHAVFATFGLNGPEQCSGLPVVRYDAAMLRGEFGPGFKLVATCDEDHVTPWGRTQAFTYTVLRRDDTISIAHDVYVDTT